MSETPAKAGEVEPLPQRQEGLNADPRVDFNSFYCAEKKHLTAFLLYAGARTHEADDLAHDALIKLLPDRWRSLDHPRAYMRRVAYRAYLRKNERSREVLTDQVPELPGGLEPVTHLELSERIRVIVNAISELPSTQRTVMAFVINGADRDEICEALNMKPGTVTTNISRARARLKITFGLAEGEKDA
ncbi:RNA polymerase sigma factor [Streptomyces sp. NPDC088253]|uniref:RNA polymerase sigma factor n=1 Tax=Streptomyces sp. NPDC088253 TaxID=3365846 RepID=UPI003814F8F7